MVMPIELLVNHWILDPKICAQVKHFDATFQQWNREFRGNTVRKSQKGMSDPERAECFHIGVGKFDASQI
jgi:hypothetical protein